MNYNSSIVQQGEGENILENITEGGLKAKCVRCAVTEFPQVYLLFICKRRIPLPLFTFFSVCEGRIYLQMIMKSIFTAPFFDVF